MDKEELQECAKLLVNDLEDDLYNNRCIRYDDLDNVAKEVLEMAITIVVKRKRS